MTPEVRAHRAAESCKDQDELSRAVRFVEADDSCSEQAHTWQIGNLTRRGDAACSWNGPDREPELPSTGLAHQVWPPGGSAKPPDSR
jgi:hypothetical protein